MQEEQIRSKLDASQTENLPLILSCLLGVQILSAVRDPIVIGLDLPLQLILVNVVLVGLIVVMLVWVGTNYISTSSSHKIILVAVLCVGAKAIADVVVQGDPLPLYMAVLMLALALCFLSYFYMMLSAGIITIAWAAAAFNTLSANEIAASFFAMTIGFILGTVVLRRRISSLTEMYQLQDRLASLESILPMCANCKKTRDESGEWRSVEQYIEDHQIGLHVSHGVCPDCSTEMYGEYKKGKQSS